MIIEKCIPRVSPSSRRRHPWLTNRIISLARKKNTLFKAWKNKSSRFYEPSIYKSARNSLTKGEISSEILKRQIKNFLENSESIDTSFIFCPCSCSRYWKGLHYSQEKADVLSEFFKKCFNNSIPSLSFSDLDVFVADSNCCLDDCLITAEEVEHLLVTLDANKSSGPVSAKMLKSVAHSIAPSVSRLSIMTGCFPALWKVSNIVPIPKKGDSASRSNYRPISLLPILSKVLEKHIVKLLMEFFIESSQISDSQWGFLDGWSTATALLSVIDDWHKHIEAGRRGIGAVFLDLQKAFDSVPHRNLLLVFTLHYSNGCAVTWLPGFKGL